MLLGAAIINGLLFSPLPGGFAHVLLQRLSAFHVLREEWSRGRSTATAAARLQRYRHLHQLQPRPPHGAETAILKSEELSARLPTPCPWEGTWNQ